MIITTEKDPFKIVSLTKWWFMIIQIESIDDTGDADEDDWD